MQLLPTSQEAHKSLKLDTATTIAVTLPILSTLLLILILLLTLITTP